MILYLPKNIITLAYTGRYCNRGKSGFFASFFRNISKTTETIMNKKIGRNDGVLVYKKAVITEHQKKLYFLR